jgi:hypothetical protein
LGVLALGGFTAAGFVFRSHRWLSPEGIASRLLPNAPAAENSTAPLAPPPPPVSPLPSLGRAGLAATSSPFTAPSASATFPQVATPTRDYELAGVTSLGQDTLLSISRRRDHRSLWIAVGKSAAEISVLSYQPDTDHAIIRVDDRVLQIAMHDAFADSPAPSATE